MTKDEDDWLSDFLELALASARQSQMASDKDYATRLKLLSPRIERARPFDADDELAKKAAASEALAGQKKFDAAADQLDAAFTLAGRLLETAAAAAAVEDAAAAPENLEPASLPDEPPAEKAPEIVETSLDSMLEELPSAEATVAEETVEENPATDLDAMLGELPSGEETAAEKPAEETPATDFDAMLGELSSSEEAAVEKPVEEATEMDLDALLGELPSADAASATEEVVSPDSDSDKSEKKERP
jgi:hypothetical protein